MATRWPTTTTASPGRRWCSAVTARPAWSCAARPTRTWRRVTSGNRVFRVGLLGHGTVGAAFASLLPQHAERIERMTGLRPELCGVMTRRSGSFDEILEQADLIVELIGGIEPAREWLLR